MKVTKQCSECGGREIYTTTSRVETIAGVLPNVGSAFIAAQIEIYVCGQCGNHQVFVPEKELAKVKERYNPYK